MTKVAISFSIIILCTIVSASLLLIPNFVLAAEDVPTLPNPLDTDDSGDVNVISILLRVMQIALAVVDIFALFMFILGGFEFLISAGNPNMIKKAKDTLIWATLGILVITLSYTILKFIFEEVSKGF